MSKTRLLILNSEPLPWPFLDSLFDIKMKINFSSLTHFVEVVSQQKSFCAIYDKESDFCQSTKTWKFEFSFLLGFYVAHIMVRWWEQISKMPFITDVTFYLNGNIPLKQAIPLPVMHQLKI